MDNFKWNDRSNTHRVAPQIVLGLVDLLEATGVPPQMQTLIHVAHLNRPRGNQLHGDLVLFRVDYLDRLLAVEQRFFYYINRMYGLNYTH